MSNQLQLPYFKLTIWSRGNTRSGQWSTSGILDRLKEYVNDDQIEMNGVFVIVLVQDRALVDKICRRIDTYATRQVPKIIDVIK